MWRNVIRLRGARRRVYVTFHVTDLHDLTQIPPVPILSLNVKDLRVDGFLKMDNIHNTRARVRRTFQYPTDDDMTDSQPEALDEQGMAMIITVFFFVPRGRN